MAEVGRGDEDGMTAGRGIDGAGETERRTEGDMFPKEDRRLWVVGGGGFMGRAKEAGVPGAEGTGELAGCEEASEVSRAR